MLPKKVFNSASQVKKTVFCFAFITVLLKTYFPYVMENLKISLDKRKYLDIPYAKLIFYKFKLFLSWRDEFNF